MGLLPFVKRGNDAQLLVVGMTGVKMGDRLLLVGCEDGTRLGAVAAKVGLSGQAVAIVPDEASANRVRRGAANAGVLVDVDVAPVTALPVADQAFDVTVVDDTGGLVGRLASPESARAMGELQRVLRPGGRVVFLVAIPRGALSALFSRAPREESDAASQALLESLTTAGLKSVRTLAERDGLLFVEGVKPR